MDNKPIFLKCNDFSIDHRDVYIKDDSQIEHYHDSYEIAFFLKANINIFVKDSNYNIYDGDMLFISEYDMHRMVYLRDVQYTRYVINFKRKFISSFLRELKSEELLGYLNNLDNKKVSFTIKEREGIKGLFCNLYRIYRRLEKNRGDNLCIGLLKSNLFILLVQLKYAFQEVSLEKQAVTTDSHIQNIIKFIDENYYNELSLDLLQKTFNLNKYYISHVFKKLTGFSVFEYIHNRRIIEAQKLLRTTQLSISEISFQCGFKNLPHFYRIFKTISKTTPYKYRKVTAI